MSKVLCFGEILLRYSPEIDGASLRNNLMPVYIGGAELNVASALAKWGIPVGMASVLPNNFFSDQIKYQINSNNIESTSIIPYGNKIGIYYLGQGSDMKNAAVFYDREYSSFAELQSGIIDWNEVFKNVDWFHLSAIAASLTLNTVKVCKEALEAAKRLGIFISFDLNYRPKLWNYGYEPQHIIPELVQYADLLMGNLWSADKLLGIKCTLEDASNISNDELIAAALSSFSSIRKLYKSTKLAYTFRMENQYFAVYESEGNLYISKTYSVNDIVDKVGSGDCFMAGLIYGNLQLNNPQNIIDFATAAAVGKLYEKGDTTNQSVQSIINRSL
jgi:2-dehydro-3-deoxygluconokinase